MVKRSDVAAVIFDMDGLVLDTEKTYRAAWREAGRALRYDFTEAFLESMSGLALDAVLLSMEAFCGSGFDRGEFNRLSSVCWEDHVAAHGIEVKRGFHPLRNYLDREGIPFCLATNSALANAEACLRLSGLAGAFSTVIARDHVARGKPAPDLFLLAAKTLGVPIGRCLVLEDSPAGIEAAAAAGAMPIMIPSAVPSGQDAAERCHLLLSDLEQVLRILRGD